MRIIFIILSILFLIPSAAPCLESLTETEARKERRGSNTFYPGENGTTFVWQPQSLFYSDNTTNHEVWKMSSIPSEITQHFYHNDIGVSPWSADGNRIAFVSRFNSSKGYMTSAYTGEEDLSGWWSSRTDGSYIRPVVEGPCRQYWYLHPYFHWSPVVPDTYYDLGSTALGRVGMSANVIYKSIVADTSITPSSIITLPESPTGINIQKGISGDGTKALIFADTEAWLYPLTIYPDVSAAIDDADGFTVDRSLDTYWGDTSASYSTTHDQYLTGTSATKVWWYFLGGSHAWWRMTTTGSAADGGPLHTSDNATPYNWGGEVEPVNTTDGGEAPGEGNCVLGNNDPWCCDNNASTYCNAYMSHFHPDRWGTKVAYNWSNGTNGPAVVDSNLHTLLSYRASSAGEGGCHFDWRWSDYIARVPTATSADSKLQVIKYNSNVDQGDVCKLHYCINGGTCSVAYYPLPRPGASPDGTKIAWHSDFLRANTLEADLFWAVAYYPYPPEITQATAATGTVTVRFDWQNTLADENPRTYTARGWPNESTSDRPIPRETKVFRLWSSDDNNTWTPVSTVDAEPFTRFDFVNGGFKAGQDAYWEISTTQAAGSTKYYAVTAQEHSGIESKRLSNTWKVVLDGSGNVSTQAQQTAYPNDPGKMTTPNVSAFYTAFDAANNSKLLRHYNIYAKDGSAPAISQTTRIASISKNACSGGSCSWVDWLGNTDASTQYVIVPVDTQGNEGTALTVTATHKKSPATADGQYTLEWSEPGDTVVVVPQITGSFTGNVR